MQRVNVKVPGGQLQRWGGGCPETGQNERSLMRRTVCEEAWKTCRRICYLGEIFSSVESWRDGSQTQDG